MILEPPASKLELPALMPDAPTLKPKIFLIENVKGLKSHDKGNTLQTILDKINDIGNYNTQYSILNSNDFDVPQKRERLIIVGVRTDLNKVYN